MKKSIVMLIGIVLLINVFTLGINIYSLTNRPITLSASSDTAIVSLYVQPSGAPAGSTALAPTETVRGGETYSPASSSSGGAIDKNETASLPTQIVSERENPLPVNKTFDVYPLLAFLAVVALLLIIMWMLIKHMRKEIEKRKAKAGKRAKSRKKAGRRGKKK